MNLLSSHQNRSKLLLMLITSTGGQAGNHDAANMVKLAWNDQLASLAQDVANLCMAQHILTNCDEETFIGQNLIFLTNRPANSVKFLTGETRGKMKNRTTSTVQVLCDTTFGFCGHYTLVVWATTPEVGCGIKQYLHGVEGFVGGDWAWAFVCDYNPPGNLVQRKPYV